MRYYNKIIQIILSLLIIVFLSNCEKRSNSTDNSNDNIDQNNIFEDITLNNIIHDYKIDLLRNEVFYFTANTRYNEKVAVQPLKQFDFIFTGRNSDKAINGQINDAFVPGLYTHILMYIGKDSDGFAYGIEITGNEDTNGKLRYDGTVAVDGQIYVYCLGSDYNKECPVTDDTFWSVLHHSDYMWAKRLIPKLHQKLIKYKMQLLSIIKNDLQNKIPFQIPVKFMLASNNKYFIDLINDGRKNGADCAGYITLILEESAGICLDEINIDAKALTNYFISDPKGQKIYIARDVNPFESKDIYVSTLLKDHFFSIRDNPPRQTACSDRRKVVGIPIPDKIFNSPSVVNISAE